MDKNRLLKIIINADLTTQRKSMSRIMSDILKYGPETLRIIKSNFYELMLPLCDISLELTVKLGVTNPKERPIVSELTYKYASLGQQPDCSTAINKLNQLYAENGLVFRIPADFNPSLLQDILVKNRLIRNGIINLEFINNYEDLSEMIPYTTRYLSFDLQRIVNESTFLEDIRNQERAIWYDEPSLRELLINALTRTGHILDSVENKETQDLIKLVFYKTIAARAAFDATNSRKGNALSKNDVIDSLSIIWYNELSGKIERPLFNVFSVKKNTRQASITQSNIRS